METAEMRRRFGAARVARLATVTAAGRPHVVPCCFALDGDLLYTGVDDVKQKSTSALSRLDHIRHEPRVSVLVDHYDDDWSALWWVRADGAARVVDAESEHGRAAWALLATKYEQYRSQATPGPVIVVAVDRWRAWP
jgi:PPOX class probable F420-dependent enzyme